MFQKNHTARSSQTRFVTLRNCLHVKQKATSKSLTFRASQRTCGLSHCTTHLGLRRRFLVNAVVLAAPRILLHFLKQLNITSLNVMFSLAKRKTKPTQIETCQTMSSLSLTMKTISCQINEHRVLPIHAKPRQVRYMTRRVKTHAGSNLPIKLNQMTSKSRLATTRFLILSAARSCACWLEIRVPGTAQQIHVDSL